MLTAVLLVAVAATTPATAALQSSPAADLVGVTLDACYPFASGNLKLGGSLDEDNKSLADLKISSGLANKTMERLGRSNVAFISQSIIGERANGDASVVLAVGGRMQGCRSILLAPAGIPYADEAAKVFEAAGWKEMPATNSPNAAVKRRMFVKLDAKGRPYLVNMFSGSLPESDFQIMTTVNAIPEDVQIPKGN